MPQATQTAEQQAIDASWHTLGIAPKLLEILASHGFRTPSPIQHRAIPIAVEGKDVIGIAQTGTGKTLAFGIPMIQRIAKTKGTSLILAPTRELAQQIDAELHKVGKPLNLRTAVLIGGASMRPQVDALRKKPHAIVATPGRLLDHMEQKTVSLIGVNILILDEADRMLDMGFMPQIKRILEAVPSDRQTMLFSATLSPEIVQIAARHMRAPVRIEVAPSGTTADKVTQEIMVVPVREAKQPVLEKILSERSGPTIVFTKTKHGAKKVCRDLNRSGFSAAEIHSNRSLSQRTAALQGFKTGKYRVLVATDIAARGIDVKGIELVLNFDLPMHSEDYVHRIGRTARAGAEGHAISLALPSEVRGIRAIERLIKKEIKVSKHGDIPASAYQRSEPERRGYGHSRGRRPSHGGGGGYGYARGSRPQHSRHGGSHRDRPLERRPAPYRNPEYRQQEDRGL